MQVSFSQVTFPRVASNKSVALFINTYSSQEERAYIQLSFRLVQVFFLIEKNGQVERTLSNQHCNPNV